MTASPAPPSLRRYTSVLRNLVETADRAARIQPRTLATTTTSEFQAAARQLVDHGDILRRDATDWPANLRREASDVRQTLLGVLARCGWHRFTMTEAAGTFSAAEPDPDDPDGCDVPAGIRAKPVEEAVRLLSEASDEEAVEGIEGVRLTAPEKKRTTHWKWAQPEALTAGDPAQAAAWRAACNPLPAELPVFQKALETFEAFLAAHPQPAAPDWIVCSKASLLNKVFGKERSHLGLLDQMASQGVLELRDRENPIGPERYEVRFRDPDRHAKAWEVLRDSTNPAPPC